MGAASVTTSSECHNLCHNLDMKKLFYKQRCHNRHNRHNLFPNFSTRARVHARRAVMCDGAALQHHHQKSCLNPKRL